MCGIAGFVNLKSNENLIKKMLNSMARRGPDENGVYEEENTCLMHQRLTVIDPQSGQQPMHLTFGNETYTIVYNGELYNTEDIRQDLINKGHTFIGHSDTEVLLHAYAQWSFECLDKMNGIFAFAIWEHKAMKLFLARDRMGVKPLFYGLKENGIIFASELKTILKHPDFPAKLGLEGILETIMLGPGRTRGCGVYKNIYELKPGCYSYFDGALNISRYWKLRDRVHTESFEETAEHIRFLVTDAIKRQMVSDVPLGTFLSGGLDSSIISSVCARELSKRGEKLKTFSVGYVNNEKYFIPGKFQPNSDEPYIKMMSAYLDTKHHNVSLDAHQLASALKAATDARDLPGMADVDASLLLFCKEIRKNVTVALSGECADEIFGGYPWFRDPDVRETDGFPWSQNVLFRYSLLRSGLISKKDAIEYVQERYRSTIADCDILPGNSKLERRMKQMMNLNMQWFMQTLLDRKDRMSMYNSLEVRVPFCDHRIAEYMYAVPWEYKDYQNREKGLLRYAMAEYLPEQIVNRKKSPYPKTFDPLYLELVSERLNRIISDKSEPIHQIINAESLHDILTEEQAWPWYGQLMRTPQTVSYMLQINDWLKLNQIDIIV